MKTTILGSGSSSGSPSVGRGWGKCDPNNPKNRRLRPSILIETDKTRLLVDTSPDLRQQLLNTDVSHLDAVIFSHSHADHLHGIDDLRQINRHMNAPIDMYADGETLTTIRQRFGYVLEPLAADAKIYYKPTLVPHEMSDGENFSIGDIDIISFTQDHGFGETTGFRFGSIAYTTDVVELPEHAFDILKGVDTWIIGTFIDKPHPTHAHVDKALDWIERVGPRRGVLSHLSIDLDYQTLKNYLPDHVEPAFDGMILNS